MYTHLGTNKQVPIDEIIKNDGRTALGLNQPKEKFMSLTEVYQAINEKILNLAIRSIEITEKLQQLSFFPYSDPTTPELEPRNGATNFLEAMNQQIEVLDRVDARLAEITKHLSGTL